MSFSEIISPTALPKSTQQYEILQGSDFTDSLAPPTIFVRYYLGDQMEKDKMGEA
jgi:hypothetical protein